MTEELRLAYVSYGDANDSMSASGVPHYLRRGFESVDSVSIYEISTRPHPLVRLVIKALSFRSRRADWERNYLHGRMLPRARSWKRNRGVRSSRSLDAVLHVRTWYSPLKELPYASFIDATVTMVRGYDDSWALSDRQLADEVEVEGEFYRRAIAVYTASRAATRSLVEDYGVDAQKITQVGAGTTLPGLQRLTAQTIADRFAAPNILFVGKDPIRKGLPQLLEGFRLARRTYPALTLTVVGPSEDAPEYHAEGVRWVGLVRDKTRMAELYAQATVFALPAHRESYGLVVPEAMAYGVPCIVSDSGELPYLVRHGQDGRVLPEISPQAIAGAVTALLEDLEKYAALAESAHLRSRDFSWAHIAQTIADDLAVRIPARTRTELNDR